MPDKLAHWQEPEESHSGRGTTARITRLRGIAPLGSTRLVQPNELVSPEQIPADSKAPHPVPDKGHAADVSSLVPTSVPPVQPQFVTPGTPAPAAMLTPVRNLEPGILNPAARTPAPVVMPTPEPQKQSCWGIGVGIAILLVGLGGGGWYISYRRSSSLATAPVSPPSGAVILIQLGAQKTGHVLLKVGKKPVPIA